MPPAPASLALRRRQKRDSSSRHEKGKEDWQRIRAASTNQGGARSLNRGATVRVSQGPLRPGERRGKHEPCAGMSAPSLCLPHRLPTHPPPPPARSSHRVDQINLLQNVLFHFGGLHLKGWKPLVERALRRPVLFYG